MGVRRLLSRKISVEEMLEFGLWVGVVHVIIGLGYAFTNYDAVARLDTGLQTILPAGSEVVASVLTALLWPLMLIASAMCG